MTLTKEQFVEREIENMKRDLGLLVSFPSVYSEDAKPFGLQNQKVLAAALGLMDKAGFRTENLDNYCGYGEIGEGEKLIGILAHLDVVPAGDGWDSDPFTMIEKDGYLYGRGVSDDKGAVVASFYAMKYLLETGYPLKKRIRLITGCNEESGSKCIEHYVEVKGHIDAGFTPDGDFPGIFAEKGMTGGYVVNRSSRILDIRGGEAFNIVAKRCEALLPKDSFDKEKLAAWLKENGIGCSISEEADGIRVVTEGKAAHASMPDTGVNAINYMLEGLYQAGFEDELTDFFHKYIGLCVHGEKLGIDKLKDEYTDYTFNIGMIFKKENEITFTVDARFPVTRKSSEILPLQLQMKSENTEFVSRSVVEPLFFDRSHPMIQAYMKAYRDVTGDMESEMEAIGGGTYAKEIHNCVAFGCAFHGEPGNIHAPNEYLRIESFKKQVLLYIEALKNLNETEI